MNVVETIRYVLALLAVITTPPALVHWYLVHPFVRTWRRLGTRLSYAIFLVVMLGMASGLFLIRDRLLADEYGTRPLLIGLGLLFYAGAVAIQLRVRKQLAFQVLAGLPELAREEEKRGRLLTEALYSRVRHPRYLAVLLGTIGWAFITNYLAVYLLIAVTAVALYGIVKLEERELRDRFGEEHADYCRRVPMFVPRFEL